jgi:hypothetical protein
MATAPEQMLEERFSDRRWRLNNLYTIKDKAGNAIPFRMNANQEQLLSELWTLNIILKARQMGFTTLIQLVMLDACLFNSNTSAGIVAHNREDAEAFFDDKIKFAYDHLDPEIQKAVPATQDSAKSLTFANGSRIRVGTSLRSGTFQYLHVSEFGKTCAQFPAKAKEIVTGAFNAVEAGQFIAVESTAEGQEGTFYDMVMEAKRNAELQRQLTPLDFKLHFFAWWKDKTYSLSDEDAAKVVLTAEHEAYFEKLYDAGIELTEGQEAWYVKKLATQRDEMKREYPATVEEAFEASIEGSYLAEQMARVRREGRICRTPIERVPVDTFWDLGVNDDMVIWFRQRVGPEHGSSTITATPARGWSITRASSRNAPTSTATSTASTICPMTVTRGGCRSRPRASARCSRRSGSSRLSSFPGSRPRSRASRRHAAICPSAGSTRAAVPRASAASITTARNGTTSAGRGRTARAMIGRATDTRASRRLRSLTSRSRKIQT